jgi:hypothetical protein
MVPKNSDSVAVMRFAVEASDFDDDGSWADIDQVIEAIAELDLGGRVRRGRPGGVLTPRVQPQA